MKGFRFGLDPVCLCACLLYALNRLVMMPRVGSPLFHEHFDDLLLIPAALPWILWIHSRWGWRGNEFPTWREIVLHWAVWSFVCEFIAPHLFRRATGDWGDVIAYGVGAAIAGFWWRMPMWWNNRRGFDRVAPVYDAMEGLLSGGLLMKARLSFADRLPDQGKILLAGEGHGRFLCHLRKFRRDLDVTCADASPQMLARAESKLDSPVNPRVRFLQCDLREFPLEPGSFDAIVTHFFLDCFEGEDLRRVVENLSSALKPGGTWLLADFQVPSSGIRRIRAAAVIWLMYRFFRVVTEIPARRMESPDTLLQGAGFRCVERKSWSLDLVYAECRRKAG